jgi:RNA polymerase sigma-B factor
MPTIIGEIKRHFRDRGWAVRVPRGLQELSIRLGRILEQLTTELERSPTIAELAIAAGVGEEDVLEAIESSRAYASVPLSTQPEGDDEDDALAAIGAPEPGYDVSEDRAILAPGLAALDPRERRIILLRFYAGLTQTQIAQRIGISQMHVSRLIRRSLEKIRTAIGVAEEAPTR